MNGGGSTASEISGWDASRGEWSSIQVSRDDKVGRDMGRGQGQVEVKGQRDDNDGVIVRQS